MHAYPGSHCRHASPERLGLHSGSRRVIGSVTSVGHPPYVPPAAGPHTPLRMYASNVNLGRQFSAGARVRVLSMPWPGSWHARYDRISMSVSLRPVGVC